MTTLMEALGIKSAFEEFLTAPKQPNVIWQYFATRRRWAELGYQLKPDATGELLPFIPTRIENIHLPSVLCYEFSEVEPKGTEHPKPQPLPARPDDRTAPSSDLPPGIEKILGPRPRARRRKCFPRLQYKKRDFQLRDSDRNVDLGTHDVRNQNEVRRKDLEAHETNEVEFVGSLFEPDSHESEEKVFIFRLGPEIDPDQPQSEPVPRPEGDAVKVLSEETVRTLLRSDERLFTLLKYLREGKSRRHAYQLMKLNPRQGVAMAKRLEHFVGRELMKPPTEPERDEVHRYVKKKRRKA